MKNLRRSPLWLLLLAMLSRCAKLSVLSIQSQPILLVVSDVRLTVYENTTGTLRLTATGGNGPIAFSITQPAHGAASLSGAILTYVPTSGFAGQDALTFTANSGSQVSRPATVSFTVQALQLQTSPADPQLIPAGKALLAYLQSVYGKHVLASQNQFGNANTICSTIGKCPAIAGGDLSGFNSVKWSSQYKTNIQNTVNSAIAWYQGGGIVTLQFHWPDPLGTDGTMKAVKMPVTPAIDLNQATTPGTAEYNALIADLDLHADYLQQLADANVPVLWRPLHEIDGRWFWWSDASTPQNSAKLWQLMFDHLVNVRGIHNLIWVYSAGEHINGLGPDPQQIATRQQYYPGSAYVDIAGIDIYPSSYYGWGDYHTSAYGLGFSIMQQVAPGKMLTLAECAGIPDPEIMKSSGVYWLYANPWFYDGSSGTNSWLSYVYSDSVVILQNMLPSF